MKTYDMPQCSEEWFSIRVGMPTASNFDKIITTKGETSKSAKKYMYKVAGEFVSGIPEDTYQNAAMLRGIELEAEARSLYEVINDIKVEQVGFCVEKDIGCSPDGLINGDGMLEIKCPSIAVHVGYLLVGKLPTEYIQQVQGQLFVTDSQWCDFMSYYPGIKPFIIRVERDEDFIKKLRVELEVFCVQLKNTINQIK